MEWVGPRFDGQPASGQPVYKSFDADELSEDGSIVLEVEASRAVVNYQFLKDTFQPCLMHNVHYLVLADRNDCRGHDDFQAVYTYLETLYISNVGSYSPSGGSW